MMPNITRGDRFGGLMTYLTGPGRANEHTEPHLVAGDDALMMWHGDDELGRDAALRIARHLDRPRKALEVEVKGGHVWHCSLSLRSDEGMLSDEQWGEIAHDFIKAMNFDDNEGTKAPCRWVAVRHGVSKNGNDHIHIAVNLVREDGTKASVHKDFKRAQTVARALEAKHGLEELESVSVGRATRGFDPAEREAQARARARAKYEQARARLGGSVEAWEALDGASRQARIAAELRADQPRFVLALKVRGCAAAAADEAEFVRRMRREGLIVRPRFADGREDVITGFSVAERPQAGERPIWYGGGRLGRDLTLPRLRSEWPDTPVAASAAAAEWAAAKRGRRVVAVGRESKETDPRLWEEQNRELSALVGRLRSVPVDDHEAWALVARQTAGALAAWSNAVEETPGDLARAAEALSRSAQTYRHRDSGRGVAAPGGGSTAAMLLSSIAGGSNHALAQAIMIRQFLRMTQAVHASCVASGQARQARLLAEDARARLVRVREALPKPSVVAVGEKKPSVRLDPEVQGVLDRLQASHAQSPGREPVLPAEIVKKVPRAKVPAQDQGQGQER